MTHPDLDSREALARVSLADDEPEGPRIRELLPEEIELVEGQSGECTVRLIGATELQARGARVLRQHRLRSPGVPMIALLPQKSDASLIRDCFREGALDVIAPEDLDSALPRAVRRAVEHAVSGRSREDEAQRMAAELGKRARDLEAALVAVRSAYDQTLVALVTALDHREKETACHSQRVALYSVMVGIRLGLEEGDLENLFRGALLHDIGKIGIPDAVLLKPGSFTEEEWEIMRRHTEIGGDILGSISFLKPASDVPLAHHEAWAGGGYPNGLSGTAIPLHARIFAIVDSYDAIRSERPYKEAKPHEEAVTLLQAAAGQRLDPDLVQLFIEEPLSTWEELDGNLGGHLVFEDALEACQRVVTP